MDEYNAADTLYFLAASRWAHIIVEMYGPYVCSNDFLAKCILFNPMKPGGPVDPININHCHPWRVSFVLLTFNKHQSKYQTTPGLHDTGFRLISVYCKLIISIINSS